MNRHQHIDPNTNITVKKTASLGASTTMTDPGFATTNTTGIYNNSWNNLTKKEEEFITKIGFKYNKNKKEWIFKLSSEIKIPSTKGLDEWMQHDGGKPSQQAIKKMKELKERLIKKLTAKLILSELIKSREIKI